MKRWFFLFGQWFKRELGTRYRGSWLGMLWPVIQPAAQIAVFTLIFHGFMNMRWPAYTNSGNSSSSDAWIYSINVLAGLAIFNYFSEILSRSPTAVLAQPNLVTKVKFPLILLPIVNVSIALIIHVVIGCVALFIAACFNGTLSWTIILLPIWVVPILFYGVGLSLLLSSLGVYIRDIVHVMPPFTSLLMFLTPIFYPLAAVPDSLRRLFELNPISWSVESLRDMMIRGVPFGAHEYLLHFSLSVALFIFGVLIFNKLKNGFSDVL